MEALKGIEVILDHTAGYKFIFLEYILVFFYNVLFNIIFYLQGKPRGQLALFASQTASPSKKSSLKKSKSDLSLRDRLTQQLVSGEVSFDLHHFACININFTLGRMHGLSG